MNGRESYCKVVNILEGIEVRLCCLSVLIDLLYLFVGFCKVIHSLQISLRPNKEERKRKTQRFVAFLIQTFVII